MARPKPWEIGDELWSLIEPLLPRTERRRTHPGRKRLDDRKVLQGILFVLHTGIQWEWLPQELGFGSGMTCWRRLRDWNEAGVWHRLQEILLARLHGFRHLRTRWERRDDIHDALLQLATCIILYRWVRAVWVHLMAMRKRKTLVVCERCHQDIHAGRSATTTRW